MQLDPVRYPLASHYLRTVAGGMNAYPHCQTMAEYSCLVQAQYPDLWRDPQLPSALAGTLGRPWKEDEWIPEAVQVLQGLILRDRLFPDEKVYLRSVYQRSQTLFARPFYKVMSHVFSPTTFLMGASRHWATRHRGITLASKGGDRTAHTLQLNFPPHLYVLPVLHGYGAAFQALVEATHVKDIDLQVTQPTADQGLFVFRWSAKG